MPANTPRGYTYPLFTDAQDFPADIQELAEDIDLDVQTITDLGGTAFDRVLARARSSTAQVIATNTTVAITFASEDYDYGGLWTPGAPTVFTFPETGVYHIALSVEFFFNGNATVGGRSVLMTSTSGIHPTVARESRLGHQNRNTSVELSSLYMCVTAPETLSLFVRHNSGASVTLGDRLCSVTKVSATLTGT